MITTAQKKLTWYNVIILSHTCTFLQIIWQNDGPSENKLCSNQRFGDKDFCAPYNNEQLSNVTYYGLSSDHFSTKSILFCWIYFLCCI